MASLQLLNCKKKSAAHKNGFEVLVIIVLEFSVKASSDAHILLAPCDGCDGYEVVIGGRNNGLYLVSIYIYISSNHLYFISAPQCRSVLRVRH